MAAALPIKQYSPISDATDMDSGIPKFYKFILSEFNKIFDIKMLDKALEDWRGESSFRAIIAYKCDDENKFNRITKILARTENISNNDVKDRIKQSVETLDSAYDLLSELIQKYKDDEKHKIDYKKIGKYYIVYRGTNNIDETKTHYRAPYIPTTYFASEEHFLSFSDEDLYMRIFVPRDTPFILTGIEKELLLPSNSRIYVLHDKYEKIPSKDVYFYDAIMEYPASPKRGEPQWCYKTTIHKKKEPSLTNVIPDEVKLHINEAIKDYIKEICVNLEMNKQDCLDDFNSFKKMYPHYTDIKSDELPHIYDQRMQIINDMWKQQINMYYKDEVVGGGIKYKSRKHKSRKHKSRKHKSRKHKTRKRKHKIRKHNIRKRKHTA